MKRKTRKKTSPAIQAKGAGRGGNVPPPEKRYKPGESGNPKGRPTAGATIREWVNQMSAQDLTGPEIKRIARDVRLPWTKRAAAERILRTMESGDLADMEPLLNGQSSLEALRETGINTEIIKKIKVKTRTLFNESEAVGTEVEREVELHDRAGQDFDRIVEHTDGKPTQTFEGEVRTVSGAMTDEEMMAAAKELGFALPPGLEKKEGA